MQNKNSDTSIKHAILELEQKQADDIRLLKEQFNIAYENVQPINIIKNTFKSVAESDELKENILNTSVGLVVGYLSKMLFQHTTMSPLKKLFGTAILFGITQVVAKNPDTVKSLGKGLLKIITKKSPHRLHGAEN